jgi:hypothetical protein
VRTPLASAPLVQTVRRPVVKNRAPRLGHGPDYRYPLTSLLLQIPTRRRPYAQKSGPQWRVMQYALSTLSGDAEESAKRLARIPKKNLRRPAARPFARQISALSAHHASGARKL